MNNFSDEHIEDEVDGSVSNPVERLHRILSTCGLISTQDTALSKTASRSLAEAMGVEESPAALLQIYTIIQGAIDFIELNSNTRAIKTSLKVIDGIAKVFHQGNIFNDGWSLFSTDIGANLDVLKIIGNNLPEGSSLVSLNSEKREQLLDVFFKLEKEVIDSDISKEVKDLILEKIAEIRSCIHKYTVFGSEPIKKSANEACGALIFSGRNISGEDKRKPIFAKVIATLGFVSSVLLGAVNKVEPILSSAEIVDTYVIPKIQQGTRGVHNQLTPFMDQELVTEEMESLHRKFKKETKLLAPAKDLNVDQ
jgi:hypothetical protein